MNTIGVIGAMEEEIQLLKETLGDVLLYSKGGNEFYSGWIEDFRIVLLKSGIGKVNAAIGTTLLISRYEPMCIINTGSAGAVFSDLNVGDIVISSGVFHHDVDVTAFGYELGQVPKLPHSFLPNEELVRLAGDAGEKLKDVLVKKAAIATGDSFLNDSRKIADLKKRFPTVAAIEMEAAGIAQTCHQFNKPFVIIRSISDSADEGAAASFESFIKTAADNSASIVIELIKAIRHYVIEKEDSRIQEAFK